MNLDVSGPGGTNSKQVLLTVAANSPPVAMPGGPYTATVGKPLLIDAGASSDADGDPLTYSWVLSRGGGVIGRYNGSTLSMTLNKPGSYSVLLTVRDNRGGVGSASTEINSYYTVPSPPPPVPVPVPAPPQRGPSVVSAPAPNARISAASLPGGAAPAAVPSLWGAAAAPAGAAAGLYPAAAQQQQLYGAQVPQQQQQQQLMPAYQQYAQPLQQQQQQVLPSYQLPYQQQPQQQLMLQQQYAPAVAVQTNPQGYPQPQAVMPQQPVTPPMAQLTGTPQGLGMCLFKDGKPDYNPMDAAAFMQGRLANSYWGPCPYNTNTGSGAPAGVPVGPDPAAAAAAVQPSPAPVSGSSTSTASAEAAAPVQSTAGIRSPEAFVKAEGAATQVSTAVGILAVSSSIIMLS